MQAITKSTVTISAIYKSSGSGVSWVGDTTDWTPAGDWQSPGQVKTAVTKSSITKSSITKSP